MVLEPRRKLGCCATSVECLFFILNITVLLCSAMFGGFAAYFYVNPDFPAALGMDEVRMILAILGGSLALLAIVGMLMTASNSPGFGKFYQLLLIVVMVSQCVGGVYIMMLQTTTPSRIQAAWNRLNATGRHLLEVRLMCCGLHAPSESPTCVASKTTGCSGSILATQMPIINVLSTTCLVFAAVEVICLLMAAFLGGQYKKLKRKPISSPSLPTPSASRSARPSLAEPGNPLEISRSGTNTGGWRSKLPESFRQPIIQTPNHNNLGRSSGDTGPL